MVTLCKLKSAKIYIIIILLLAYGKLSAQEYSLYQDSYLNPFIINPAVAGSEVYAIADCSVKKQWVGFTNPPETYSISVNSRLGRHDFYNRKGLVKRRLKPGNQIGVGASIFKDNNGPLSSTGGLISYSYHFPVNDNSYLSLGASVSGIYYSFNSLLLDPDQPDDMYLLNENENTFRPNFTVGVYFYNYRYYFGLSSAKIFPDINQVNDAVELTPAFFLIGGYKLMAENDFINIEPSLIIKTNTVEGFSADIYTKLYLKKLNWIALSYGTSGKLRFLFALRLNKKVYAGYNYEYFISDISRYSYGSHELHVGVNLGLSRIKKKDFYY